MAKSGSTPIEFTPKMYLFAGLFALLLAVTSFYFAVHSGAWFGLIVGVFWMVIATMALRRARG